MKNVKLGLLFTVLAIMLSVGCKDKDQDTEFDILTEYLTENNMDVTDMLDGWIVAAGTIEGADTTQLDISTYYIMDIRAEADFNAGHIIGAHNSSLSTIVADAADADKKILVVCYTGQSASHAVIALRLSGYTDAQVLKFGMSSWNADFDSWTANTGDAAVGNANWVTTATANLIAYEDQPNIATGEGTGAEILAEQVKLLTEFKGITNADVLAAPADYFINNYWAREDVDHYGHIKGAYRINPLSIAGAEYVNLDPTKTIVTYCWTGQTSSMITAYLTVLGYDAKSLKFGTNGMIYSDLETHKWGSSFDFDYE